MIADGCSSYTGASGQVWTQSGTYSDTVANSVGCDSITIYNLTLYDKVINTNDRGPGSLRFMIDCASPGDTIQFDSALIAGGSDTIFLNSKIQSSKSLYKIYIFLYISHSYIVKHIKFIIVFLVHISPETYYLFKV